MSSNIKPRQAYKEIIFTTGVVFVYLFRHFTPVGNRANTNVLHEPPVLLHLPVCTLNLKYWHYSSRGSKIMQLGYL